MAKSNKNFLYWFIYGLIFAFTIYFATISISQAIQEQKEFELFKQSWQYVADTNFEKITEIDEQTNEQVTYYGISTPEQLAGAFMQSQSVQADSISSFSGYKLTSNIDLSGKPWTTTDFSGVFDGNSFHIQNLTVCHSSKIIGFVGQCFGTIKNVYFDNINVTLQTTTGSTYYIGAIAGKLTGTIQNVYVNSGTINGSSSSNDYVRYAGGLVGYNGSGTIKNCINKANVKQSRYIGGITGYNNGTIQNCINNSNGLECGNNGSVGYIGGICAENSSGGKISLCINNGNISQRNNPSYKCKTVYAGGIVGLTYGPINQCANEGYISAGYGQYYDESQFAECSYVGGIAGYSSASIANCYNRGNIEAYAKYTKGSNSDQNINTLDKKVQFASGAWAFYNLYIVSGTYTEKNASGAYNTSYISTKHEEGYYAYRGGIVGYSSSSNVTISNCYNTGTIFSSNSEVKQVVKLYFKWKANSEYNLLIQEDFSYGQRFNVGAICANAVKIENCYNSSSSSKNSKTLSTLKLTQTLYEHGKHTRVTELNKWGSWKNESNQDSWYLDYCPCGQVAYHTIHGVDSSSKTKIVFSAQYKGGFGRDRVDYYNYYTGFPSDGKWTSKYNGTYGSMSVSSSSTIWNLDLTLKGLYW